MSRTLPYFGKGKECCSFSERINVAPPFHSPARVANLILLRPPHPRLRLARQQLLWRESEKTERIPRDCIRQFGSLDYYISLGNLWALARHQDSGTGRQSWRPSVPSLVLERFSATCLRWNTFTLVETALVDVDFVGVITYTTSEPHALTTGTRAWQG